MKREGHTRAVGDRIRVKGKTPLYESHSSYSYAGQEGIVVHLGPSHFRTPLIIVRFRRRGQLQCGNIELAFFEDEVELVSSDDSAGGSVRQARGFLGDIDTTIERE